MVKLAIASDMHLNMTLGDGLYKGKYQGIYKQNNLKALYEVALDHTEYLVKNNIDIYLVNGDISWNMEEYYIYIETIEKYSKGEIRVLTNFGNHELDKNFTKEEYINYKSKNYLKSNPFKIGSNLYIGTSGLFDGEQMVKKKDISDKFMDEVNNRYFKKNKSIKYGEEITEIVEEDIHQLENLLENIKRGDKNIDKINFLTHYVPKSNFYNPEKGNTKENNQFFYYKNMFLGSDKYGDFIDNNGITSCYFGHNHWRKRARKIGNCNYKMSPTVNSADWRFYNYTPQDLDIQWKQSLIVIEEDGSILFYK